MYNFFFFSLLVLIFVKKGKLSELCPVRCFVVYLFSLLMGIEVCVVPLAVSLGR